MNITQLKNAPDGTTLKDDEVRGLEFRVRGDRRGFFFYYRNATGERRRPKVGDFPTLTIVQARQIARGWAFEVAAGGDPSKAKTSLRASETVSELCDRYVEAHTHKKSARHDVGRINRVLKPRWGDKRARQIGKDELAELKIAMAKTPTSFNRVQSLISSMWTFGEVPITLVKKNRENKRERYLSAAETDRFGEALDHYELQYPHVIALIRILYITGARFSEIALAKLEDLDDGVLYVGLHKTSDKEGSKMIALPLEAQEIIANLEPRKGKLCGVSGYPSLVWDLVRDRAKLKNFRLHDLRHSFASDALAGGATLGAIGEVLGHKDAATTKRYAHLATQAKMALAEKVASSRRKA
jgi:integrase